jgi:hypothetical protein
MATPNYMKRITFLDGQVLHDFHLNIMQKNISEAIKLKTTQERYDMLMLVSPYNYYYSESFIDNSKRHSSSTAVLNTLTFTINADQWITNLFELPENTEEIYLLGNFEDYPNQNCFVDFHYRTNDSGSWIKVSVDSPIYLPAPSKFLQIKIDCRYTGTIRPTVYDFAVLVK